MTAREYIQNKISFLREYRAKDEAMLRDSGVYRKTIQHRIRCIDKELNNLQKGKLSKLDQNIVKHGLAHAKTQKLLHDGDHRMTLAECKRRSKISSAAVKKGGFPTFYPYGYTHEIYSYLPTLPFQEDDA